MRAFQAIFYELIFKAELPQEGMYFFRTQFICMRNFIIKKFEIEKTKPPLDHFSPSFLSQK